MLASFQAVIVTLLTGQKLVIWCQKGESKLKHQQFHESIHFHMQALRGRKFLALALGSGLWLTVLLLMVDRWKTSSSVSTAYTAPPSSAELLARMTSTNLQSLAGLEMTAPP